MRPFHFGPPGRRLFGCFHPAEGRAPTRAVLICGPYGQESVRAHRMLRVLAERLARSGCDVLRFDPYGCADSSGEEEAVTLPGWIDDVRRAADELAARSAVRRQAWIGTRLGATAACLAAVRRVRPPADLVLCEPVLDGMDYLRSLAAATVQALEASCSIRDAGWRRSLTQDPLRWEREAVGFMLHEDFHRQVRAIVPAEVPVPQGTRVTLLSAGGSTRFDEQAQRWRAQGALATHEALPFPFDWTAEEALNTAIVPHEMLRRMAVLAVGGA